MPDETRNAYFEHAQDVLEATISLIHSGQRCALVASLSIEGKAAREIGALAVIAQTGTMTEVSI
jgi:xanthine dehydrogenase accessory factor